MVATRTPTGRLIELNARTSQAAASNCVGAPARLITRMKRAQSPRGEEQTFASSGRMQKALLMRDGRLKRCKVLTTVPRRHILSPIPDGLASLGAVSSYFSRI